MDDDELTPSKSDESDKIVSTTETIFLTPSAANICIICHEDITQKYGKHGKQGYEKSRKRKLWNENQKTQICLDIEKYLDIEVSKSRDFQCICSVCWDGIRSGMKKQQQKVDSLSKGRDLSSSQFLRSRTYTKSSTEPPSKKQLLYEEPYIEKTTMKVEISTEDKVKCIVLPTKYHAVIDSIVTNKIENITSAVKDLDTNNFTDYSLNFVSKIIDKEMKTLCSNSQRSSFNVKNASELENITFNEHYQELHAVSPVLLRLLSSAAIRPDLDTRNSKKTEESLKPSIVNIANSLLLCRNKNMNTSALRNAFILRRGKADKTCFQRLQKLHLSVEHTTMLTKQSELSTDLAAPVLSLKEELEKQIDVFRAKIHNTLYASNEEIPMIHSDSSSMQLLSVNADESFFEEGALNPNVEMIDVSSEVGSWESDTSTAVDSLSYLPAWKQRESVSFNVETESSVLANDDLELNFNSKFVFAGDNVDIRTKRRQYATNRSNIDRHLYNLMIVKNRIPIPKNLIGMKSLKNLQKDDISLTYFIPTETDEALYQSEIKILVLRDLVKYVDEISWMKKFVIAHIPHEFTKEATEISEYFPLGIIDKNEATTEGIIDIMREQHQFVPGHDTENMLRMLSFGDLLTVERQENAQEDLRDATTPSSRLEGLIPALADFHTFGNFLEVIWHHLYNAASAPDIGTLFQARNFLNCRSVPSSPMDNVNACEDLLWKYSDALLIAAYEDLKDNQHIDLTEPEDEMEAKEKIDSFLSLLIDQYITPKAEDNNESRFFCCPYCNKKYQRVNSLRNHVKDIHKGAVIKQGDDDGVRNYSVNAISLSYLAKNFNDARKHGDGERITRLYKFLLLYFKLDSRTKYAYQSLHFLCQVSFLLPKALAFELKWNRFVNTKGKIDSNVEIDRHVEHENKYIKQDLAQYQGKLTEKSIARSSKSYGKIQNLMSSIDSELKVKEPSGKHTKIDASEDVRNLAEQYREANIFGYCSGRYHWRFPGEPSCTLTRLNMAQLRKWISKKVVDFSRKNIYSLDNIVVNL